MKKYVSMRDEEYKDILQWLKEEYAETYSLNEKEAIKMRDTLSFQIWRSKKAYREFATAIRETA